ncbi:MAG: sugar transferase [Acidimicrobiia bacterium]|nr:sugar transferase [Acidimicrobiia bacterium]
MAAPTRDKPEIEAPAGDGPSGRRGVLRRRAFVVACDVGALIAGALIARRSVPTADLPWWSVVLFALTFWLFIIASNLYNSRLATDRNEELARVARSGVRAVIVLGLVVVVLGVDVGYRSIMFLLLSSVSTVGVVRECLRLWFARRRQAGQGLWGSVLVAGEEEAVDFRRRIEADSSSPHIVLAHVDPDECEGAEELVTRTVSAARRSGAQGAIVVESLLDARTANALVRGLLQAHLYVDLASTLVDISADRLATRSLGSGIVTWIAPRPKSGWRGRAKRLFDVVVASTVLAVVSPVFAVIALVIKVTSPGAVFFRQERVGRYGEPFDMLKFRSMVVNAEELLAELQLGNEGSGPLFKMKSDPRVTSIGRFIRKSSLDELPQLLNVLRNEMSLVGPRPALRAEMADWEPALYARLDVKPGITGMWQVSGRSGTTFAEYTRLDLYYVHNWSMLVDLSIMLRTIPAVLRSEGAY